MNKSTEKWYGHYFIFFLTGILFLIIGFNGESLAFQFSGSQDGITSASGNLINTFNYVPLAAGVFFIILAIIKFWFTSRYSIKETQ